MRGNRLFQDWNVNRHDLKIQLLLVAFRLAQWVNQKQNKHWLWRAALVPYGLLYEFIVISIFHMEIPANLTVGQRLRIFHGFCLVIHSHTQIGDDVTLRHGVTLGNKGNSTGAPVLADGVEVGSHAQIIGAIKIGKLAVVGAGAVVTKNVPPGAIVVGNPAKIIKYRSIL